jgi:glycosyltransferase involved in cell wall biosynthesis
MEQQTKISIITIVYNRIHDIKHTIESVLGQEFKDIEYIIIDGASTDGTIKIINTYKDKIQKIISEKDVGIYDAMNKGLKNATGEFVLFMNAGDSFFDKNVLKNIFSSEKIHADFIYGDTMFVDMQEKEIGLMSNIRKRKLHSNLTWKEMNHGMMFCHQSFIVKRKIAPFYNLKYKLSADIDWIIQCMKNSNSNYYYDKTPIANFQIGGASVQNQRASLIERFQVLANHFGYINTIISHIKIALKFN